MSDTMRAVIVRDVGEVRDRLNGARHVSRVLADNRTSGGLGDQGLASKDFFEVGGRFTGLGTVGLIDDNKAEMGEEFDPVGVVR